MLSPDELAQINDRAKALKEFQTAPDTPEAAATIPKLNVEDIPKSIETTPTRISMIGDVPVWEHDLFTNGIVYVDLAFDLADIPEELQIYLPLLGKMMTGMGAAGLTYEEMAKRIALKMDDFGYNLGAGFTADGDATWEKMIFSFKALYRNLPEAMNIIGDVICRSDLSHEARMRDLISERKNNLQSAIVPSGHLFARMAAGAALTLPAYRDEQWHGRTQLKFVQTTAGAFSSSKQDFREKLEALRVLLFRRNKLVINVTADDQGLRIAGEQLPEWVNQLPSSPPAVKTASPSHLPPVSAGISIPSQVSYVAYVLKTPSYTDPASPLLLLSAKEMSNNYLYKHIRVQGGAYGGMSSFDSSLGLFSFLSYRDPHIAETLKVYLDAQDFYARNEISPEDMEKAIKQAGGNLTTTLFRVTIEPVDLPDGAVTGGWNIRTEMVIDRKPTDISGLLPNAQVAVDMEVVAKLLTNLDRYDEKTFDKHFTLRRDAQTQKCVFVAPYQDDELEKAAYPSVLFASRYLLMPLDESGVVDVVMVPIEEDATDGSVG